MAQVNLALSNAQCTMKWVPAENYHPKKWQDEVQDEVQDEAIGQLCDNLDFHRLRDWHDRMSGSILLAGAQTSNEALTTPNNGSTFARSRSYRRNDLRRLYQAANHRRKSCRADHDYEYDPAPTTHWL
ncbi:MAG: hypothetical protein AAGF11_20660 [Myxococcota bacterium]